MSEKKLFTEGKIEIERVIDANGEARFQVRFQQTERDRKYYGYQADVVMLVHTLVIGNVQFVPAVKASKVESANETKHFALFNVNEESVSVAEGEYLNL
jgi:Pyruvate/2-oxoacid:ferredoxin oxidoreductase gamma subunit